jgi:disulfide bond formation protein DsbB
MAGMSTRRLKLVLAGAALAAAAAFGVAYASEIYGGLVPCALCLVERWPYRIAIAIGVIGLALPRGLARLALALLSLTMFAGAAIGFVHVGVEQGWWPSPLPECAAPRFIAGGNLAQRFASMPAAPSKSCEEPTYLIAHLPVSMAMMDLLFALALGLVSAYCLIRSRRSIP